MAEPWLASRRHGCLLRKKEDHGMFENPWKNRYMCWLHGKSLKMKPAEVVLAKSGQGTVEQIKVSGIEEAAELEEWQLSADNKDKKGEKFTLINKINGMKISLKADTAADADGWVQEISSIIGIDPGRNKPTQRPSTASGGDGGGGRKTDASGGKASAGSGGDGPRAKAAAEPQHEKLHGKGLRFKYDNGDVYEGDFVNGKKHGDGKYTRADGSVFDGEYKNDKKHGRGRCSWANGNSYVGMWAEGSQHGHGILLCPDGRRYEGDWRMGKQHGRGTFSNAEGDIYEGEWKDGLKHGKGKMTTKDGHLYDGDWIENKKWGRGRHTRPDKTSYDGDWKEDKKHGKGVYRYANGDTYEGDTRNGQKHGYGVFKAANGASYAGWWVDGKKHGKGTYVSASGESHEGWWKDNQPDPKGGNDAQRPHRGDAEPTPQQRPGPQATGGGGSREEKRAAEEAEAKKKRAEEQANERADRRAQERIDENERMRRMNNSTIIINDLAPQLEAVKKAAKVGARALIQHIYKEHPPKRDGEAVPTDFSDAVMKKTILKSIRTYHQDKNPAGDYGLEWHLLCREITKQLNAKLELYK